MPPFSRRRLLTAGGLGLLALLSTGCDRLRTAPAEARSSKARAQPDVPGEDLSTLAAGMHQFGLDLFRLLGQTAGSAFCSPYSVLAALSMLVAGARGATAEQMRSAMRLTLPPERLHPALNALSLGLAPAAGQRDAFTLQVANDLWAQQGLTLQPAYLDTLAAYYGAGLRLLDFAATEEARRAINDRVADTTEGLIPELLGPGALSEQTRLVVTNAVYFKAKWQRPFTHEATSDDVFTTLAGEVAAVPMMRQRAPFAYVEGADYQAVELPYQGNAAMVAILPGPAGLAALEERLDGQQLLAMVAGMASREVQLHLPRVRLLPRPFRLSEALAAMGMVDAFDPAAADFSGIDGAGDLFISEGVHQATLLVDEEGTEAAAATAFSAVGTGLPAEPPVELRFDRPFLVLIRDLTTGAPLFFGRVADPRQ